MPGAGDMEFSMMIQIHALGLKEGFMSNEAVHSQA